MPKYFLKKIIHFQFWYFCVTFENITFREEVVYRACSTVLCWISIWNIILSYLSGHYKYHPIQYRDAMATFLETVASSVFPRKLQRLEEERIEGQHDEISELICDLQNAAVKSTNCLRRIASGPGDNLFLPSSTNMNGRASEDEHREASSLNLNLLQSSPAISAHSILGQMLFDVCVPKNVEGWDIKFSGSLNGQPYASSRKLSPPRSIKCIRRSRL